MVFKSKSQYLALLVAFWRRQVSASFDCNLIFDDNARFKAQGPFSSSCALAATGIHKNKDFTSLFQTLKA